MLNERKISNAKPRSRRTSFAFNFDRRNSTNSPLNQRRARTSLELKPEGLDSSQLLRRKSSNFSCGGINENFDEDEQDDYRERYRNVLREIYAEQELEKRRRFQQEFQLKINARQKEPQKDPNKFASIIRYMVTEHETLLQIMIFVPLILTACYISLVEQSPLITKKS